MSWNLAWNLGEIFRATFSRVWVCDGKFHQNFTSETVWKTENFTQISLCWGAALTIKSGKGTTRHYLDFLEELNSCQTHSSILSCKKSKTSNIPEMIISSRQGLSRIKVSKFSEITHLPDLLWFWCRQYHHVQATKPRKDKRGQQRRGEIPKSPYLILIAATQNAAMHIATFVYRCWCHLFCSVIAVVTPPVCQHLRFNSFHRAHCLSVLVIFLSPHWFPVHDNTKQELYQGWQHGNVATGIAGWPSPLQSRRKFHRNTIRLPSAPWAHTSQHVLVKRIATRNCPRLGTFKTDSWLPTERSGLKTSLCFARFVFLTCRRPFASHNLNRYPNRNRVMRYNATKFVSSGSQTCRGRKSKDQKTFQIILLNNPPKYCKVHDNPHRLFCKTLRFEKLFWVVFLFLCFFPWQPIPP